MSGENSAAAFATIRDYERASENEGLTCGLTDKEKIPSPLPRVIDATGRLAHMVMWW